MSYKTVRRDGVFGIDIPGFPGTMTPDTSTGIRRVPADQKALAIFALDALSFSAISQIGTSDEVNGEAVYVLFAPIYGWATTALSQGYAILVPWPIPTAEKMPVKLMKGTFGASNVASWAGITPSPTGDWMVIDGPEAMLAEAGAKASGGALPAVPPLVGGCPVGYVLNVVTGKCDSASLDCYLDASGNVKCGSDKQPTPGQTSVTTQTPTVTPTWVWPVVIGGIALVLVGAAVVSRPQRASYGTNSRYTKSGRAIYPWYYVEHIDDEGFAGWARASTKEEVRKLIRWYKSHGYKVKRVAQYRYVKGKIRPVKTMLSASSV
jgi:hypothetical protein